MNKVAIVGGGAAGLTAAISAAENGADVTIYECNARCGKKILATGNGRCNMTNINADVCNYRGENPEFIIGVKNRFWVNETLDFFERIGILPRVDGEGRVYPYSNQASSVLDVLRFRAQSLGVCGVCSFKVNAITKNNDGFSIKSQDGRVENADAVIITTGGKAAPSLGSKDGGYALLKSLGHTITPLSPSLVPIKTETDVVKKLKGIRINARAMLGEYEESGEIQFTEYGLSGIAIFSLSSRLSDEKVISLDIAGEYSADDLKSMIYMRMSNNPDITLENFFTGMLNKRVGQCVLKCAGVSPLSRKAITLSEKEINGICSIMKNWEFVITGTMSWNNAQVTRGGAKTDEFNSATLESKKIKRLYAAGETLDIDGDCGGYNLQWAWASGYIAGKNAAKSVADRQNQTGEKK